MNSSQPRAAMAWLSWALVLFMVLVWAQPARAALPLLIGVSQSSSTVAAGQTNTYTIVVSNIGTTNYGSLANNALTVYATVPGGASAVSAAQAGGGACSSQNNVFPCTSGQSIVWSGLHLSPGASITLHFSFTVSATAAPADGTALTSTISTNDVNAPTANVQTVVRSEGGLSLNLVSSASNVLVGSTVQYLLNYSNTAVSSASATLAFTVPAGVSVIATSAGSSTSNGVVRWNLVNLGANSAGQQWITLQLGASVVAGNLLIGHTQLQNAAGTTIYAQADAVSTVATTDALQMAVSATPDPVQPGQVVTYDITASNTGNFTYGSNCCNSLNIRASVPNNTTVVSAAQAGGGSCSNVNGSSVFPCTPGQDIVWSGMGLALGASVNFHFSAQVNASPAPSNGTALTTVVTSDSGGAASGGAIGQALVGAAQPTLSLTAPEQVTAGASYTYTLAYANSGSTTVSTQLSMPLPAGTSFVSATAGGMLSGGVVSWNASTLAPGQADSVALTVTAPSSAGAVIAATAEVVDTATSQSYSRSSVNTTVASKDALQIAVSAMPDPVQPGQAVTYDITLSNTGNVTYGSNCCNSLNIRASVPNNTMVVSAAQAGGGSCSNVSGSAAVFPCTPGQDIVWSGMGLAAGASVNFHFSALVNTSSAPSNGTLLATVVSADSGGAAGGAATGLALVGAPQPTLLLSAPGQVKAGTSYTYTLTYANSGSTTVGTQLSMPLPAGTSFVSATAGGMLSGGVVSWNASTLAPGQADAVALTVTGPSSAGAVIAATAEVIDTATSQSYSRSSVNTTVASTDGLQIAVSATPDPVQPGQVVTYDITLSNTGNVTYGSNCCNSLNVRASIPNNTTVVSAAQAGGGACSKFSGNNTVFPCTAGQDIVWLGLGLAPGASITLHYSALVSASPVPSSGTLLTTVVSADSGGAAGGAASGLALVGAPQATLLLSSPEQVTAGASYTYTLTYGNSGSTTTPMSALSMALPAGTSFVSATAGGVLTNGTVSWNLGVLSPGQADSVALTVTAPSSTGAVVAASAELLDASSLQSYSRSSVNTTVASTDALRISVSATPDPVQAGQSVTYGITVYNAGNINYGSLTNNSLNIRASIPNSTSVSSAAQAGGGACSNFNGNNTMFPCAAGQDIVWLGLSLAPGASKTLQFTALVSASPAPANGTLLSSVVTTTSGGAAVATARVGTATTVAGTPTPSDADAPLPLWSLVLLGLGLGRRVMRRKP